MSKIRILCAQDFRDEAVVVPGEMYGLRLLIMHSPLCQRHFNEYIADLDLETKGRLVLVELDEWARENPNNPVLEVSRERGLG